MPKANDIVLSLSSSAEASSSSSSPSHTGQAQGGWAERPGCRSDPLESRSPASRQNSEFGGVAQIRQGQRGRHRLSRHLPARECDVGPRMSCLTKARGDRRGSQPGATVPSTPGDTRQRLETFWPSPPELGAGVLRHLVGSDQGCGSAACIAQDSPSAGESDPPRVHRATLEKRHVHTAELTTAKSVPSRALPGFR